MESARGRVGGDGAERHRSRCCRDLWIVGRAVVFCPDKMALWEGSEQGTDVI